MTQYASVEEFYRADEARRFSPVTDLGAQWRQRGERVLLRVVWLEDTGELCVMPTRRSPVNREVEVLAMLDDLEALEACLPDWRHQTSIDWVRGRVARLT